MARIGNHPQMAQFRHSAAPVRFLALGSKIVGVQHYDGVVSDRESVVLRRQPANIYDPNAIQVQYSFKMYYLYPLKW